MTFVIVVVVVAVVVVVVVAVVVVVVCLFYYPATWAATCRFRKNLHSLSCDLYIQLASRFPSRCDE